MDFFVVVVDVIVVLLVADAIFLFAVILVADIFAVSKVIIAVPCSVNRRLSHPTTEGDGENLPSKLSGQRCVFFCVINFISIVTS